MLAEEVEVVHHYGESESVSGYSDLRRDRLVFEVQSIPLHYMRAVATFKCAPAS